MRLPSVWITLVAVSREAAYRAGLCHAVEQPQTNLLGNARAHLLIALLALLRCTAANGSNRPEAGITRVDKAAGAETVRRSQSRRTARMCSAFYFSISIVLFIRHPMSIGRQAVACPKAAHKSGTYRSPRYLELAALVPSAGTITL